MKNQTLRKLMKEYFDAQHVEDPIVGFDISSISDGPDCPISPRESNWEIVSDPNRYMKSFKFDNFESFNMFLKDVFLYQEDVQHHGRITIDGYDVIIEVYTHDVNDVTEIDKEYIHMIDNIYQDTQYSVGFAGDEYV